MLPRVVLLDLRDDNPQLCHDIARFQPSKSIKVISDCKYSTTEITTYSTSEIPATYKQKHVRMTNRYLALNQASQETSLTISLRKSQEWKLKIK